MDKVIITKAQADAIEAIKAAILDETTGTVFQSMASVITHKLTNGTFYDGRAAVNGLSNDDFITALSIGYEVQVDPAAQLVELIAELKELREFTQERVSWFDDKSSEWSQAKFGAYQRVDYKVKAILAKVGE